MMSSWIDLQWDRIVGYLIASSILLASRGRSCNMCGNIAFLW